jgi:predicted AAA+ superfamily ATPase
LLPPFEANLKKRLVKSPRVYWRDTGLLHALLGLRNNDDLFSAAWVGASWEGWVIEQIITTRRIRGERFQPYFFRSHDGLEVDLVIEKGGELELIEIKLTTAPSPEDFSALTKVLLTRTPNPQMEGARWSVDLGTYLANCDR